MTNLLKNDYNKMKDTLSDVFFSHICENKLLNNHELSKIHKCSIAIKAFDLV